MGFKYFMYYHNISFCCQIIKWLETYILFICLLFGNVTDVVYVICMPLIVQFSLKFNM